MPMMLSLLDELAPPAARAVGSIWSRGSDELPAAPRIHNPARPAGRRWPRLLLAGVAAGALVAAPVGAQGISETDRAALEALYQATDGPNWGDNTNWLTDAPLGEWHGVATDEGGRVTSLDLGRNQLSGLIPSSLGSLANLTSLTLWGNQLSGPIPSSLGSLASLTHLDLSENQLSGLPSSLGSLANLEFLYLSRNQLSGTIPSSLGSLANLTLLDLSRNQLSGLPSSLGSLANLEFLNLSLNQLSGTIPSSLGSLANLEFLNLADNQFSGEIPDALGSLANLEILILADNQFSGEIPDALGSLANLEILILSLNQLSGTIPSSLGSLANLEILYLSDNQFSGTIPAQLGNLTSLTQLLIDTTTGLCLAPDFDLTSLFARYATAAGLSVCTTGPTGAPTPKPPAVVQPAVNDAIAAATNGDGLRTGGASVTVPLDALFTFTSSAASAVTYAGATFSVSSTAPGVVSVSTSMTDAGPAVELTPGEDAGTATVTVDARPEGQPDAPPLASVMFEVEVAQAPSTDATLSGLVLSDGTGEVALTPAFDPATQSYTAMVGNSVASVAVTATVADDSATVTVNGVAVASGSPGDAIDLEVGENVITVVVTAEDGATTVTYTVTVTQATVVPALPLGGALLFGILLVCLGGRRLLRGSTS